MQILKQIRRIGMLEYWNVGGAHKPLSLHISIGGDAELVLLNSIRSAHKLGFIIPFFHHSIIPFFHHSTIPSFHYSNIAFGELLSVVPITPNLAKR